MEIKSEQPSSYTVNAAKTTKQAGVPSDTHVSEQAHTKKADDVQDSVAVTTKKAIKPKHFTSLYGCEPERRQPTDGLII